MAQARPLGLSPNQDKPSLCPRRVDIFPHSWPDLAAWWHLPKNKKLSLCFFCPAAIPQNSAVHVDLGSENEYRRASIDWSTQARPALHCLLCLTRNTQTASLRRGRFWCNQSCCLSCQDPLVRKLLTARIWKCYWGIHPLFMRKIASRVAYENETYSENLYWGWLQTLCRLFVRCDITFVVCLVKCRVSWQRANPLDAAQLVQNSPDCEINMKLSWGSELRTQIHSTLNSVWKQNFARNTACLGLRAILWTLLVVCLIFVSVSKNSSELWFKVLSRCFVHSPSKSIHQLFAWGFLKN